MKFVVICTLVVAVVLLESASAQNHNNQWGVQEVGDRLLHREIVKEKSKFLQKVSKDVNLRVAGTIHHIKAIDQYVDDNGGFATLVAGGIGYNEVTVHLKSKRNHGFNFIIELYGR